MGDHDDHDDDEELEVLAIMDKGSSDVETVASSDPEAMVDLFASEDPKLRALLDAGIADAADGTSRKRLGVKTTVGDRPPGQWCEDDLSALVALDEPIVHPKAFLELNREKTKEHMSKRVGKVASTRVTTTTKTKSSTGQATCVKLITPMQGTASTPSSKPSSKPSSDKKKVYSRAYHKK